MGGGRQTTETRKEAAVGVSNSREVTVIIWSVGKNRRGR
jgi:hypothetical protein